MNNSLAILLLSVYSMAALFNFIYSLNQVNLAFLASKKKKGPEDEAWLLPIDRDYPMVTVQLPVYNELYVVRRLIDAVCACQWPADKLEIQVLDDSTDETTAVIADRVAYWKLQGIHIGHIRRPVRTGYKAGALAFGTELALGEFIAIFDADFVPHAEFLLQTIPYFKNDRVGVVQTRWGHLNENYSLLTRLQALGLNTHFYIENTGRRNGGHFLNFNGTAGIWRTSAIADAGGWKYDTLTEDLDLSYRAQLRGWSICFRPEIEVPAELPVTIGAVKSQQFRWTKGAAEATVKLLGAVWRSPIPLRTKWHGLFHLMNSFVFVCMATLAILSLPMLYIKYTSDRFDTWIALNASLFALTYVCLAFFYWSGFRASGKSKTPVIEFMTRYIFLICVALGIAIHNTIAVAEGYLGIKTPFVRTPKYDISEQTDSWRRVHYTVKSLTLITVLELLMIGYFSYGISLSLHYDDWVALPFHLMQITGFGMVVLYSLVHRR